MPEHDELDKTQSSEPTSPETTWAEPVSQLTVSGLPVDAVNLNVQGKRLAGPVHGFGQMWQKTYRITFEGASPTPSEVIREWKAHFSEFWPQGNRFFSAAEGITPGDVVVLNLAGPRGVKIPGGTPFISTGVLVIYADEESFSFMTPEGHIFAGMITFSAERDGDGEGDKTTAQIHALVRANDPLYEVLMRLGMSKSEDEFWCETLKNLAAHFGASGQPTRYAVLIDPGVRWHEAKNIWQNAAIRTALYTLAAPVRWIKKRLSAS